MEETAATKELKQIFTQIRDERRMYANTSSRIGDAFLSLLSYLDSFKKKDDNPVSELAIGDIQVSYDNANGALALTRISDSKALASLYATGGLTAYGAGSGMSGGGTSYDRLDKWSDYTTDKATYILSALLGDDLNTRLSAVESSALTSVDWSIITGKPSTFAPSAHTHLWADITDHPTQLSAFTNDAGFTTNAGTVTSVALSVPKGLSVSGSPVTASGTLAIALSSGYSIPTTAKQTQWDTAYTNSHTHANKSVLDGITSTLVSNWNSVYSWYTGITATDTDNIINKWQEIIAFLDGISSSSDLNAIVSGINTSISNEVTRAKDSESVNASNITTLQGYFSGGSAKTATKLLTVRSLWGNSFDGTDDVSGNITMKPDDGTYIQIGGARIVYDKANSALYVVGSDGKTSANFYATGGLTAYGAGSGTPSAGTSYNRLDKWSDYTTDKATYVLSALLGNDLNTRVAELESSTLTSVDWSIIANKPSTYTPAPHTHSFQSLTGIPTTLSGYGITDAALASHTHTFASLTSKPTTLAGYSITDANISSGVITLGANTITPLTAHQDISGKSDITHTHTVSINGTIKTIAATGGAAVDLGTYLTSHQSLTDYMTIEQTGIFVDGKIGALDVAAVGGAGSYIQSILETDGKISAVAGTLPTKLSQFTNDSGYWLGSSVLPGMQNGVTDLSFGSVPTGVSYYNHYNGSALGNYRAVLTAKDGNTGVQFSTYWCVNNGDTPAGSIYYRVKRDNAPDWSNYRNILDAGNYSSYALPLHGTADTSAKFATAQSIALTGDITGSASSQAGWSIATAIGAGKVTNAMLAGGIDNGKLSNSALTIAGTSVALGGSIAADTITSVATKLGTATKGSSVNPIYLNAGVPTACSYAFGNGSGNVPVSNGTVNTNLNADMLDGYSISNIMSFSRKLGIDANNQTDISIIEISSGSNMPDSSTWHQIMTWGTGDTKYTSQFAHSYATGTIPTMWHRQKNNGTWGNWITFLDSNNYSSYALPLHSTADSATALATARSINGTAFNGTSDITTALWGTARNISIGNTTKSVNGSADLSWSLSEIGALAAASAGNSFNESRYLSFTNDSGGIGGLIGVNDYWRIIGRSTATNAGYLEIATGDDAAEPIYVRQYNNGYFGTLVRSLTLLDESGNSSFPGTVTAPTFSGALSGNATSASKVNSALSWSGYNSGSFNGSSAASFAIPNNTNQLTNGAGFITSSASITGNAATATKLATARTLWGQSFDGTGNISGALTGVTTISASGAITTSGTFHAGGAATLGAGLTVTGNILATGGVTAYTSSDRRLKKNIRPADSLRVIRTLGGTFEFDYRKDNRHSIGFIAQNVRKSALSDMVCESAGYLRINYLDTRLISLALGASVELDDEVTRLKKRVSELEKEVKRLKAA